MNRKQIRKSLAMLACAAMLSVNASAQKNVKAPEPVLPLPEQKQVDWQKM